MSRRAQGDAAREECDELRARIVRLRNECEALEWEVDFYRDLFLHAPDMCVLVDIDTGAVRLCNETTVRRLGYAADELIGRPYSALFARGSLAPRLEALDEWSAAAVPHESESEVLTSSGVAVPVSVAVGAVRDASGRIVAACLLLRDTAEQRAVLGALQNSERRFARLANTVDMIPWEAQFDARGMNLHHTEVGGRRDLPARWRQRFSFTFLGPQCERILGFTPEQCMDGRLWAGQVDVRDRALVEARIVEAVLSGSGGEVEFSLLAADGRKVWFLNQFHVAPHGDGRLSVAGVLIDVTEQKVAANVRQALLRELDHRVKNTLTIVLALADRTAESVASPAELGARLRGRVGALARVHALASGEDWGDVRFESLARTVLGADSRIQCSGPAVSLPVSTAQPVAMALHELVENARVHGALSRGCGTVVLEWSFGYGDRSRILGLDWRERGGPAVAAPRTRGFGRYVLEEVLPYELEARTSLTFASSGVDCSITFPIPARVRPEGSRDDHDRAETGRGANR